MQFAASIGHVDTTLSSFTRLVQAHTLVSPDAGLDARAAGMRLINLLSPDTDKGKSAKAELVQSLADAISSAPAEHVMLLRNLSLTGFASLQPVWSATATWMTAQLVKGGGQAGALLPAVAASHDANEAISEWRSAIKEGSLKLAARQPRIFAAAFWG